MAEGFRENKGQVYDRGILPGFTELYFDPGSGFNDLKSAPLTGNDQGPLLRYGRADGRELAPYFTTKRLNT